MFLTRIMLLCQRKNFLTVEVRFQAVLKGSFKMKAPCESMAFFIGIRSSVGKRGVTYHYSGRGFESHRIK